MYHVIVILIINTTKLGNLRFFLAHCFLILMVIQLLARGTHGE